MASENIFSQYIQPIKSVNDWRAEENRNELDRLQLAGARSRNALQDLVMQQQRDDFAAKGRSRNAIANVYTGLGAGASVPDIIKGLYATGDQGAIEHASGVEKSWLDRRKTEADIGKAGAETADKKQATQDAQRRALFQTVGALNSADDAMALINSSVTNGTLSMQAAQVIGRMVQTDPKWQVKVMMMIGDPDKARDILLPHIQINNTGGATVTQAVDKITGIPTVTGQVKNTQSPDSAAATGLGFARLAEERRHNGATEAQANGRVTYQTDASGSLVALPERVSPGTVIRGQSVVGPNGMTPVPGKDSGLNDSQSKALLFGSRMQEADKLLNGLERSGTTNGGLLKAGAESAGRVVGLGHNVIGDELGNAAGTAVGALPGWAGGPSESQKQYEQAQRDFVNAVLRRESGASISPAEFDNARKQYFPQPNDPPSVIAQKARNRALATQGMLAEVPQGKRSLPNPQSPAPSAPSADGWSIKLKGQ